MKKVKSKVKLKRPLEKSHIVVKMTVRQLEK